MGHRAVAASERVCARYDRVAELADKVSEDIDQITMPGVPVEIGEEDSLVTQLETLVEHNRVAAAKG